MAYEVTATRKRPQDFDRLVGQEFVVSTLENAIREERIAHAYLFAGPRGVGKTSSARLLAKSLNCERGMSAHPCGECSSCREIKAGTSLDVIEIDGASNTSVNDVRKIKEEVLFPPQSSRFKIYIIDEVHMLSGSAFNALLKTIEEPPEYVVFIFATTEIQKVPATIKSRCQVFRFQLIPQEKIEECLREAAGDLGIEADEDALFWISREATGSMRDAYTLFDQVASFSSDHITLRKIQERLNIAGFSKIRELVSLSLQGNTGETMEKLGELLAGGVSPEQITRDGADFFRSLLFYKSGIRRPSLLGVEESEIPQDVTDLLSREQLEAGLNAFLNLYRDLRYTLSPRFELELVFSRLASLPFLVSSDVLVKKIEDMKKGIAEGNIVIKKTPRRIIEASSASGDTALDGNTEEKKKQEAEKNERNRQEPSSVPLVYTEEEKDETTAPGDEDFLRKVCDELDSSARSLISSCLLDAKTERNGGEVVITVSNAMGRDLLTENRKSIEKAVFKITGEQLLLRVNYTAPKEVLHSGKMKALMGIFGGKIITTEKPAIVKSETEKERPAEKGKEERGVNDESAGNDSDDEDTEGGDGENPGSEGED